MYSNFFVTVAGIIAERLALFASLGFSIASALIILRISGIRQNDRNSKGKQIIVAWFLLAVTGIVYLILTFNRNEQWQSRETLFLHDIRHLKNSVKANDLTAAMLYQQAMKSSDAKDALNKLEQSAAYYKQAVSVMPGHFSAYKNIGLIYLNYLNRPAEALPYFRQYLVADSNDQESLLHLAYAYDRTERKDSAIITLKKLMVKRKTDPALRSYISNLYYYSGNKTMAMAINDSLKSEYPASEIPFINMGNYAIFDKDTIAAIEYWEKAFDINPGNLNVCNTLYAYFLKIQDSSKASFYKEKINALKSSN
jgi:tetratricopeptide (TPR) repeat protein